MHLIEFTDDALDDLNKLNDDALKCLNRNFISLIRNGYDLSELPGRYKPSWEAVLVRNAFHAVFIDKARDLGLWHYHFGYTTYKKSDDPVYLGNVSDAIAHTRRRRENSSEIHEIIQICLEHPSPFKMPWERIKE